ncbi:unnamed protein product [Ilex paraguariensis]|uniref:Uncharacterized protein n=1 Tax=Ilex paraguariensis TaxID=185542 RepID=A0ABC8SD28_9AQUA
MPTTDLTNFQAGTTSGPVPVTVEVEVQSESASSTEASTEAEAAISVVVGGASNSITIEKASRAY